MNHPPTREELAQLIHQELLRELGHEVSVTRLLDEARYARDVLLVCDAMQHGELPLVATLFRQATAALGGPTDPMAAPGHARQPNEWGGDTSGFGLTQPPPLTGPFPRLGPTGTAAPGDPGAATREGGERRRGWLERWRRG